MTIMNAAKPSKGASPWQQQPLVRHKETPIQATVLGCRVLVFVLVSALATGVGRLLLTKPGSVFLGIRSKEQRAFLVARAGAGPGINKP